MQLGEWAGLEQVRGEAGLSAGNPDRWVGVTAKARPESSARLANVERLRIVAMLEIVTFHVGGAIGSEGYRLPIVAGLGLPVFLLLNNAFNTTLSERLGPRAFLDLKVTRLLMPWLIWSLIYGTVVVAEKVRHHESLSEALSPWMIIGGTYDHLWFVPFALFGSLLIANVQMRSRAVPHPWMVGLALGIGAALVWVGAWLLHARALDWPLVQWMFALPSLLLGFALGRALLSNDRGLLRKLAGMLTVLGVLMLALTLTGTVPDMAGRYAVSMALVTLFFLWPGVADVASRRLTPLLFGVYLIHPLLVRLYQGLHLTGVPTALLGVLVFLTSALLVEALRRSPLRRLV